MKQSIMNSISLTPVFLVVSAFFLACGNPDTQTKTSAIGSETDESFISLSEEQAAAIFSLPVHCLEVEYPNKLGQVLGSDADLKPPKALRPLFYGCFDWHSSVHGYWSIMELLKEFPSLDTTNQVRELLRKHITPENVAVELAFFQDPNNLNFERTYGWAWLFKLQESLYTWDDPDAQVWRSNLQPLVDLLVERYHEYLPKLVYPIRTGQHDNSAFGLSLSLDYARTVGNTAFESLIEEHTLRLFKNDVNCNLSYEPSGYDFLSPCFEEAYLMSKVMAADEYDTWLNSFLPELFQTGFELEPAIVKDRSDGKLVHLDGLNYSRAACLYGIASANPDLAHLKSIAREHIAFTLPNISVQDDYMGSHWLGTFALYALKHGH